MILLAFAASIGTIIYATCFLAGLPALFIGILSYIASSVIYYIFSKSVRLLNNETIKIKSQYLLSISNSVDMLKYFLRIASIKVAQIK